MAWTAPTTRTTGELITAAIWNTDIVDNLAALKAPPSEHYELNEASNYTTNSASFVDVDAGTGANTKLRRDITIGGSEVLVSFSGHVAAAGSAPNLAYFDIDVDGARNGGDDGYNTCVANGGPIAFTRLITGLTPGAHIFKLQWKVRAAGVTGTLYAGAGTGSYDLHPQFWVREVS